MKRPTDIPRLSKRAPNPDVKPVTLAIPDKTTSMMVRTTADLVNAGKRVALLAEPMDPKSKAMESMMILCASDRVWFYAGRTPYEWCAREWTPVQGERLSPATIYTLQADYLIDGLRLTHDGGRIYFAGGEDPILFVSPCGAWALLVMPIRNKQDQAAQEIGQIAEYVESFDLDEAVAA